MNFIHDNFLLQSAPAERLYHEFAAKQPIIDYHCHLPPDEIAKDKSWDNLGELWLGGDHYKWRAMRANGIDEAAVTGSATWKEKFLAYAATIPHTLGNPLYHWTHLELSRCFGIDTRLSPETAESIWEAANARIQEPGFTACGLLRKFDVRLVGTTDDPADALDHHAAIAAGPTAAHTCVAPTFRPDKAMAVADPAAWNAWIDRLATTTAATISAWPDLVAALKQRHDDFHAQGARLSDHGLNDCPFAPCTDAEAAAIFSAVRSGETVSVLDQEKFATALMQHVGRWNAARDWTMQLHLGPLRNVNALAHATLGADTGFDSINDEPITRKLGLLLNSLEQTGELPRTILYNVNPAHNHALASMIGNFQGNAVPDRHAIAGQVAGPIAGKIQFGSAWWHTDTLEGMTEQIRTLASIGLLSHFVGMLTDSRSFLSFPRHEYFRRLLCNLLGTDIQQGLIPEDYDLVGDMVARISYGNAAKYFGFELPEKSATERRSDEAT